MAKAELLGQYSSCEADGLVENFDAFKKALSVYRDRNIPTRLNVVCAPDIINELRTFAVLNQFRLQFGRA